MDHQNQEEKWEGKVSARLTRARADQIWPLFKDFFNFHTWFPSLSTCYGLQGTNGETGCIRYCSGFSIQSFDPHGSVSWSTERLTAVDDVNRFLSYEIVDSNIGFKSYKATVRIESGENDGQDGCVIEWSFAVDPVEGKVLEELVKMYEVGLKNMAQKMEDALAN